MKDLLKAMKGCCRDSEWWDWGEEEDVHSNVGKERREWEIVGVKYPEGRMLDRRIHVGE